MRHFKTGVYDQDTMYQRIKKFAGHPLLSAEDLHSHIYEDIISSKPFMYGRFGTIEIGSVGVTLANAKKRMTKHLHFLCNNAGFFPYDIEMMPRYVDVMIDSMREADYQGVFISVLFESYCVRRYMKKSIYVAPTYRIEPWYAEKPWTKALKGKKVLVIHPFADTIRSQYEKRQLLFENEDILPEFDLQTIKAVQSIGGTCSEGFDNWFEALDWMHLETRKVDFDIAIIGCGAYGYPLAARIKADGKQAIHMAGITQVLFGIKGNRWEYLATKNNNKVFSMYNDHWVRPSENETPKLAQSVEDGCYW